MNNFNYYNKTKLVFGNDRVSELKSLIGGRNKILLHYGGGSIKRTGLYDKVVSLIEEAGAEYIDLGGVEPNPKLSMVYKGIEICRNENVDLILAVGGGSSIDSAKAISAGVFYHGDVWDFFTKSIRPKETLALGVILTLPATGSEASNGTVITKEEGQLKRSFDDDLIRPEFSILDPTLTLTLPDKQTFAGITDIISHILERYFTQTENVDLTDRLCEATLVAVMDNSLKLVEDKNNLNARAEIMFAGTIAHCDILGLGRREDWASHKMGHEMSALYGTTHGISLSIMFPAWMKYVYKDGIGRFIQFGERVFGLDLEGVDKDDAALQAISAFEDFLHKINMPTSFKEAGISTEDFSLMAEKATLCGPIGGFKKLDKEDVEKIYKLAEE